MLSARLDPKTGLPFDVKIDWATGRFLTEIVESLREGSDRLPVEAFQPILTKHWEPVVQPAFLALVLAQTTLGERLTDGFTVKLDYEEAYLWYGLASENGDRVAALSARRTRNKLDPSRIEAIDREISRLLRQSRAAQSHH